MGLISGMITRYRPGSDIDIEVVDMDLDEGLIVKYEDNLLTIKVDEITIDLEDLPTEFPD